MCINHTILLRSPLEPCSDGRAPPRLRRGVYAGRADPNVAFQASYCSKSAWATVAAVTAATVAQSDLEQYGAWNATFGSARPA